MTNYLRIVAYPLYRNQSLVKRYCTASPKENPKVSTVKEVPGLSRKVVAVPDGNVGPGASKSSNYKNPEYFCYDKTSYFEAEIEMLKFRLPQPSSIKQ